jgi:hypothetical protein
MVGTVLCFGQTCRNGTPPIQYWVTLPTLGDPCQYLVTPSSIVRLQLSHAGRKNTHMHDCVQVGPLLALHRRPAVQGLCSQCNLQVSGVLHSLATCMWKPYLLTACPLR